MIKPGRFLAVMSGCFAFGVSAGWVIWGKPVDPVDQLVAMLDDHCLEFVEGGPRELRGYERVAALGKFAYRVPDTAVVMTLEGDETRVCSFQDILQPVFYGDIDRLHNALHVWVFENIAPRNAGDMVRQDIVGSVGDPHVVWRRTGVEDGWFLFSATFTRKVGGSNNTLVKLGRSTFLRPLNIEKDEDA